MRRLNGLIKFLLCLIVIGVLPLQTVNSPAKNLLPNSSFEITTVPDVPDGYDHYLGPKKFDQWFSRWSVEENDAFHGKKSLMLEIQGSDEIGKVAIHPVMHPETMKKQGWKFLDNGGIYTFSAYMKSSRQDMPVRVSFGGGNHVTVGKKWERYVFTKSINTNNRTFPYIAIIPKGKGQLYIDALQLEKGEGATVYSPASYDRILFSSKKSLSRKQFKNTLEDMRSLASIEPLRIKTNLSYYTSEQKADININISPQANWPLEFRAVLKLVDNATGKIVSSTELNAASSIKYPLGLTELAIGEYSVVVQILSEKGESIHTSSTKLYKQKKKENEVKINYEKRCLLVDGEQFFIIGAAFMRTHLYTDRIKKILQQIQEKGYTTVIASFSTRSDLTHGSDEEIISFFDIAHQLGLKVIPWINPNAKKNENGTLLPLKGNFDTETLFREYKDEIDRMIPLIKDHPALLAWYLYDEPWRDPIIQSNFTEKLINYSKKLDKYHPLYVNYGALKKDMIFHGGGVPGDIVSLTQYPIPNESVTQIAELTSLEKIASEDYKPVTLWLQFWGGYGRYSTPAEFSSMTYLALIYGANGFQTWPIMPSSELLWKHTSSVIDELKFLLPIFTNGEQIEHLEFPSENIHSKAIMAGGSLVIVAVNSSPNEVEQDFNLDQFSPENTAIKILFEKRTLSLDNNKFKDKFAGFERHVYVVPISPENPIPAPFDSNGEWLSVSE